MTTLLQMAPFSAGLAGSAIWIGQALTPPPRHRATTWSAGRHRGRTTAYLIPPTWRHR